MKKWGTLNINDFIDTYQDYQQFHGPNRRVNYPMSGAAVHFFMLYKGGILRKGFIQWAREAYRNTGNDQPTKISKLYEYLGMKKDALQEAWETFCKDPDLFDF